jgi:hypothetical protein
MRALKLLPALTVLLMSLQGCAQRQSEPLAAAVPRKAEINKQLAARCPTPGQLNYSELMAVASDLQKGMPAHWNRVAAEYDRMDDESQVCRKGGK